MNRIATATLASQTDAAIASGKGIRVFQIIVAGVGGAGTATFETYGTSTAVMTIPVLSGDTIVVNFGDEGVLFASGLQLTTAATTLVTTVHSPARVG